MKMFKYFVLELLICFALVASLPAVHAQADQSGFISIDCGLTRTSNYTDSETGLFYTSDASFIDTGINTEVVSPTLDFENEQWSSVRSFPEGKRNCYTLRPENGKNSTYLIRASFYYGNYDGKSQPPVFDLYIGQDLWVTVRVENGLFFSIGEIKEIIHTPSMDYIHVCLHRTGETVPFISALELRPLNNTMYNTHYGSLGLCGRFSFRSESHQLVRYPDDVYDRNWGFYRAPSSLSTNETVKSNSFRLPSIIISTALTAPNLSRSFPIKVPLYINPFDQVYVYLHFAEIQKLKSNELRQFKIYLNGDEWYKQFSPTYLQTTTLTSVAPEKVHGTYTFTLTATGNATLPPIINAMEMYVLKKFQNSGTTYINLAAMFGIKSYYGVRRNWQGDPCMPQDYIWEGLNCNYHDHNNLTILSLNLSSSGLNGSIAPHIANLTYIKTLDLSNNNLDGYVPDFLAQLNSLKVLYLAGNNFNGTIPAKLLEKSKQGLLSLSIGRQEINASKEKRRKDNKSTFLIHVVAPTVAAFLVIFFIFVTLCIIRRRRKAVMKKVEMKLQTDNGGLEKKSHRVTYSEILKITNSFERVLGKGGFGTVYYGLMDGNEVAVKMLNPSSTQGYKEFQAEANLLTSVHHKNLTSFMGYCNEGSHIGIIYEYMTNGNLQQHLSELNWEQRLRIAVNAAQGLDYLHHGCKPPIIHRDIKPTNILLKHNFQAKLSDFGLSKAFSNESNSYVSVNTIVGTPGYLDPECHYSFRLTERSDVYSFGVVLLEIITGRPVIEKRNENRHITDWVLSLLQKGDIRTIMDQRLRGNFNVSSAWKVVELAMCCVSSPSSARPTMFNVVVELNECLATELCNLKVESTRHTGPLLESECGPSAR